MAKSPRKASSANKATYSQKLNPMLYKTPRYGGKGGKSFHNYNFQAKRNRRLSIAESISSEGSDDIAGLSRKYSSGSESESSLTAMSEDDETAASRRGSVFFDGQSFGPVRLKLKKTRPPARKKISTKKYKDQASDLSDENDDDDDNENDEDNDVAVMDYVVDDDDEEVEGLGALYSMVDTSRRSSTDSSSSQESPDVENDYSSSDDSEVDFVQLQAERRAKSMDSLRGIKGLPKPPANGEPYKQEKVDKANKRRRSSTYRRRSEVALPEGINFKFEFDDSSAVINEEDEDALETSKPKAEEEEDLGEEVVDNAHDYNFDLHYTEPTMDVPKFKDDEFNSEEEYEFDDNDLLATLQADNDIDEFITEAKPEESRTRQGSLSSVNEDDTEDPFLREEEKYLVNEFEANGFDDEDDDTVATAKVMDSFKDTNSQKKQVLQYASSSDDSQFGSDLEDDTHQTFDDDDGNDYIDLIDFDTPIFYKKHQKLDDRAPIQSQSQKSKKKQLSKSHKRKGPLDSEDDDDSYLWNYFFSSDADSENESEPETYDLEEQFMLEQIFQQDMEAKNGKLDAFAPDAARESSLEPVESDHEYDSGESTDVDLSLPASSANNQTGSKVAKEVLSSKTADYRPPVLGTWVAVDCKPFGIIDGLSTRTLNQTKNPRSKGWRNFSIKPDSEDSAIELDELLNISELDNDDENDIRIWRDFNNNKKHVPLGAFRDKLHINNQVVVPEPMAGFSTSKMNTDFNTRKKFHNEHRDRKPNAKKALSTAVKDSPIPSKKKRRRQSNADAVSEGYRPTKSGLFSENVLADVEEVLGDDRDFIALIKGL